MTDLSDDGTVTFQYKKGSVTYEKTIKVSTYYAITLKADNTSAVKTFVTVDGEKVVGSTATTAADKVIKVTRTESVEQYRYLIKV